MAFECREPGPTPDGGTSEVPSGALRLDELITGRYQLEALDEGCDDMLAGKNIRGVLTTDP
ncbi:alcohol dehydrogenase [Pseudonocardia sp. N23]|nr:alcohol dehydrogenase [Pseudonocardia sp. N23]